MALIASSTSPLENHIQFEIVSAECLRALTGSVRINDQLQCRSANVQQQPVPSESEAWQEGFQWAGVDSTELKVLNISPRLTKAITLPATISPGPKKVVGMSMAPLMLGQKNTNKLQAM